MLHFCDEFTNDDGDEDFKFMKRFCTLIILFTVTVKMLVAQDVHFSQYYATPLTINPSYTGSFTGDYRAGINYRQQWGSVTVPYKTFDFYGDMSFNKNRFHHNYFSAGLILVSDRAGDGDLSVTKVMGSGAFHFNPDGNKANFISFGVQAGMVQKSVDFTKFYFDNQWNDAGFDTGLPNEENYLAQKISYPDVAAGISYSYSGSENISIYAGIAAYHILRPQDSFYGNTENRLGIRPAANAGTIIRISDLVYIYPSIMYMYQTKAHELLAGSMLSFELNTSSSNQIFAGLFGRFGDAVIPVIGYQFEHWRAFINYDVNTSELKSASGGKGAFELSISYTGRYKKPTDKIIDLPCPRF
jgi:type IX secretion system PorP/SprF family membrane protein